MNKILYALMLLTLTACQEDVTELQDQTDADTTILKEPGFMGQNYYENLLNDSLRLKKLEKALNEGDTMSYNSVMEDYGIGGFSNEFLLYDIIMAEKYQIPSAYFDIFILLYSSMNGELISESILYKKMADYNLLKAWQKGDKNARSQIRETFGENFDSLRLTQYLDKLEQHLMKETIAY